MQSEQAKGVLQRARGYLAPSAADQAVMHAARHIARGCANVAVAMAPPVRMLALTAIVALVATMVIMQQ